MRHAKLLISARFDGDGIVKAAPEAAIARLDFVRLRHFKVIERHDARHAAAIEQRLAVRAVVEEKRLVVIALAEVAAQDREHTVFRFDLRAEYAVKVGKAGEAAELLDLARKLPHGLEQRQIGVVAQAREQRRALAVKFDDEAVNGHLLVGKAGEKRAAQEGADFRTSLVEAAVDALRVGAVRHDRANFKKGGLVVPIAQNRGGAFFFCVAFKHAAEEPFKAAVVLIDDLAPCHSGLLSRPDRKGIAAVPRPVGARGAPRP